MLPRLDRQQIARFRLRAHHLSGRLEASRVAEVARDMCGVQSQLLPAARLSLWARTEGLAREDVDRALWSDRTLVRAWGMRGTVFLFDRDDYPYYVAAWRARDDGIIRRWVGKYDEGPWAVQEVVDAMVEVLADGPLTRKELSDALADRVDPRVRPLLTHSWGGMAKLASLQGEVCFGPDRGQNVTFASTREWLGALPEVDHEEALDHVLRRYLHAFGPATHQDLMTWSATRAAVARSPFERLSDELVEVEVPGRRAWVLRDDLEALEGPVPVEGPDVHLLPHFDAFLFAHRDRSHLVPPERHKEVYRKAGWISPAVLVDGRVAGTWSQQRRGRRLAVAVTPLERMGRRVRAAIGERARDLGRFLGAEAEVSYG